LYGSVSSIRISRDERKQVSKGFAHIEYSTPEEACEAVEGFHGREMSPDDSTIGVRIVHAAHLGDKDSIEFRLPKEIEADILELLKETKIAHHNVSVLQYWLRKKRGQALDVKTYGFRGFVQALQTLPQVGLQWKDLTAMPYLEDFEYPPAEEPEVAGQSTADANGEAVTANGDTPQAAV